jgi:hypothetical protein
MHLRPLRVPLAFFAFLPLLGVLLLSGCATGSVDNPTALSYGVKAEKITEEHYTIQVSGAAVVSEAGIRKVFHDKARELSQGRDYKYRLSIEPYSYTSHGGFMAGGIYIPQTYTHNALRGNGYIYVLSTTTGQPIDLDATPAEKADPAASKPAN